MKINSRSRIALNAMLDVAVNGAQEPVTLTSISERQQISLSYLEQLFRRLRTNGLVKSARGPGGGYQLAKRTTAISVAEIVEAVELEAEDRQARLAKRRNRDAITGDALWNMLDRHLLDYLKTVSLEAVMQQSGIAAPSARVRALRPAANVAQEPRIRAAA